MPVQNGTSVNFGFAAIGGFTIGGFQATLVQRVSESVGAEREVIKNYQGDRVADVHTDQVLKCELEVVISATGGIAAAKALTVLGGLSPGTNIIIAACAEMPDLASNYWEVVGSPRIEGTNTTAKRVTIPIERCAGIVQFPATA